MKKRGKKQKRDSLKIKELKHQARRHSIKEGIFATIKNSLGDQFFSPFAIAINTSNSMIAMFSAISGLIGPLTQMFSSKLMKKHSRKKIVLNSVLGESLMFLPLIIIALLFYFEVIQNLLPTILLIAFSFYVIFSNISGPAWFSWMGDITDDEYRGRWFAKRNFILGIISVIFALSGSLFLDYFNKKELAMMGFVILFSFAFLGRMISRQIFKKQYEPKMRIKEKHYFSFKDFIKSAHKNNFGKFTIFRTLISFAGSISAPLLAVYLLRNLNLNYLMYIIIIFSGTIFSLLVMRLWGVFADKYGNYKTMAITSILLPIIPILWVLNPSPIYLILIPSFISGVAWTGFNLAAGNFIYDNVSIPKRGFAVSYFNMLNGIGIFLGAGIGAILIKVIPSSINPILIIFIISSIIKMIMVLWWLPKMQEIRKIQKIKGIKELEKIIIKEIKPTMLEEFHEILSIKKYLIINKHCRD